MSEAVVSLSQLRCNVQIVRQQVGARVKILFPIKADGYGHGAVALARAAQNLGLDYLGVANVAEALELREAGITMPILIFSSSRVAHASDLARADVDVTLASPQIAEAIHREAVALGKKVRIHVKVDTGMGRNGALPEEVLPLFKLMRGLPQLIPQGIFSHFSCSFSEQPDDQAYTRNQIKTFNQLLSELDREGLLPPLRHIANSSGLIQYFDEVTTGYYNLVRPGILLYGYPEVRCAWTQAIRPILRVRTWIVSIKELPAGHYIGYGRHYRTPAAQQIATLPVGYADGLIWLLANQGEVALHGKLARIVGGISMDQITIDVTHIPEARVGDEVEIIGDHMPAEEIARRIGANFTEIVLTALSKRVTRVYVD
jgi:alanine racemase